MALKVMVLFSSLLNSTFRILVILIEFPAVPRSSGYLCLQIIIFYALEMSFGLGPFCLPITDFRIKNDFQSN